MSTKTSFKRIAAVAAVALTLGGFSAVSANASVNANALYHSSDASITAGAYADVASDTSNIVVGSTAKYGIQSSFVASQAGDTATVVVALTQNVYIYPDTNQALPSQTLGVTTGAGSGWAGATNSNTNTAVSADGMTVSVGSKAGGLTLGSFYSSFTPTLAGTYVVTYTSTGATTHTWTINVYADAAALFAATNDTVLALTSASGTANVTSTMVATDTTTVTKSSTDATVAVAKTASTTAVATIKVFPVNAAGTDLSSVTTLTATISGAGSVTITNANGQSPVGRSVVGAKGAMLVKVYADGTNAVGTVTITGTTPGSTTAVALGTKKVSFYGAAAAISTPVLSVNAINGATSTAPLASVANAGVLTATVTDAAGIAVPNLTVYVVSADKTKIADQYVSYTSSSAGLVTAALNGLAQGTTTVTITTKSSATDASTTTISSAATSVRVGSNVIAKQTEAFNAATYLPGSLVTWTITAVDAAGLAVTDGTSVAWSLTSATLPTAASSLGSLAGLPATYNAGIASFSFYAPLVAGTLKITGSDTSGTTAAVTTQTAEVAGGAAVDAAQAAQDAANEATDAANAATDAANNAMDSADAAQQAAMDAGDKADAALAAVTDLASKVSEIATRITSLSAVVAKIAAAVAKISAKVKA